MCVRVDNATIYEPDVLVRCGKRLDPNPLEVTDPLIVVEVRSPSTVARDAGARLEDYFHLTSVRALLDREA
jgi:Uma2 family endonuclease